jgi:hypothetical protein
MTLTVSPTLDAVFTKVRAYLLNPTAGIVPVGTPVIRGPMNRAAQPAADHVIITPVLRSRIRTNVETDSDPYPSPGAGEVELEQGTRLDVQVDFYGAQSGDWAAIFSTIWRSEYACTHLAPECAPLYADEGRMIPLVTGEEQYLERWTITAVLQYNPTVTTLQEFAGAAVVDLINVDERYPPS